MKKAREFLTEEYGIKHIQDVVEMNDYTSLFKLMEEYAGYVGLEILNHAAEGAVMKFHCGTFKADTPTKFHQMGADNIQIDKESILRQKAFLP